jgi:hypothetical protein
MQMKHAEWGDTIGQYWVINVMREVDALDWDRTRWLNPKIVDTDPHPHLNIIKAAFRLEALQSVDIFRLQIKNEGGVAIYISRRLKRCLEKAGATSGMKLIPIPAY